MSDLKSKLWQIDCQLITAITIHSSDVNIPGIYLDDELRRLLYKALKPVLYKRARASLQLPLPISDNIDFDAKSSVPVSNVELTSDTLLPDSKPLSKGKKS